MFAKTNDRDTSLCGSPVSSKNRTSTDYKEHIHSYGSSDSGLGGLGERVNQLRPGDVFGERALESKK